MGGAFFLNREQSAFQSIKVKEEKQSNESNSSPGDKKKTNGVAIKVEEKPHSNGKKK